MNLKEHYKARLNEGLFNQNNPIVKAVTGVGNAVTGVGNLIRGRPFGGGTHKVTSVSKEPFEWTDTMRSAKDMKSFRNAVMSVGDNNFTTIPIMTPGVVPNPKELERSKEEMEKLGKDFGMNVRDTAIRLMNNNRKANIRRS